MPTKIRTAKRPYAAAKALAVTALAAATLAACAPMNFAQKVDQQLVAEPDPVGLRLASAADRATAALQTLASVEQHRTPAASIQSTPAAPQELRRAVSVEWIGPIEPLARQLADRAGYRFLVNGDQPPAPLVVSVMAKQRSVVEVLRDVGLQAGARADIAVDVDQRIVELNYAPAAGG
jgi:defect-in-organelle-trafficking protein DotD